MLKSISIAGLCFAMTALTGCGSKEPHPGQEIWEQNCQVCHAVGLAGAPKFGDTKAWQKGLKRGKDSLYQHALEGWGDMPARGGNAELSDKQVKHAVDYMLANSTN